MMNDKDARIELPPLSRPHLAVSRPFAAWREGALASVPFVPSVRSRAPPRSFAWRRGRDVCYRFAHHP